MVSAVFEPGRGERIPHWGYRLAGIVGLIAALILTLVVHRMYKGWRIPVVKLLRRFKRHRRQATYAEAEKLVAAVRWVGRCWPGRVACLETSLGATIAGVMMFRIPVWCEGARFNPEGFHAWVEAPNAEGRLVPVAEIEAEYWPYKAAVRV